MQNNWRRPIPRVSHFSDVCGGDDGAGDVGGGDDGDGDDGGGDDGGGDVQAK